jgi:hypothetical protein
VLTPPNHQPIEQAEEKVDAEPAAEEPPTVVEEVEEKVEQVCIRSLISQEPANSPMQNQPVEEAPIPHDGDKETKETGVDDATPQKTTAVRTSWFLYHFKFG